ncbi:mechanosensitive ion channel family protein [Patulibacter minatonensis]|uniref:mechanosensitive ion channel family protein n=1 Tax=Patulibacter minatonensis TaxID=298163 RepID=UPI0006869981|nr:mechanosensitive ion channel family protein [Patulibacter minatonensis]
MSLLSTTAPILAQSSTKSAAAVQAAADRKLDRAEKACGEAGSWQGDLCRHIYDGSTGQPWNKLAADVVHWLTTSFLDILVIFVVAWIVNRVARRMLVKVGRAGTGGRLTRGFSKVKKLTPSVLQETQEIGVRGEQRREAVLGILKSIVSGLIYATAIFMALGKVGIDLGPLLAGAGVVGVALGFGAQTLVGDFLSGIFILVEDQYGVGDEVTFRPKSASGEPVVGVVEALSLRNTRLRAINGTVWHVPNGEMRAVGNTSQHWSRAVLDVPVAHGVDIQRAKEVIARAAESVRENDPAILEPPAVWGVQSMSPNGITIRLVIKTTPSQQWRVTRTVREALIAAFDKEGIEMPVAESPTGVDMPAT